MMKKTSAPKFGQKDHRVSGSVRAVSIKLVEQSDSASRLATYRDNSPPSPTTNRTRNRDHFPTRKKAGAKKRAQECLKSGAIFSCLELRREDDASYSWCLTDNLDEVQRKGCQDACDTLLRHERRRACVRASQLDSSRLGNRFSNRVAVTYYWRWT